VLNVRLQNGHATGRGGLPLPRLAVVLAMLRLCVTNSFPSRPSPDVGQPSVNSLKDGFWDAKGGVLALVS
jgi:hypothetical protein